MKALFTRATALVSRVRMNPKFLAFLFLALAVGARAEDTNITTLTTTATTLIVAVAAAVMAIFGAMMSVVGLFFTYRMISKTLGGK